MGKRQEKLKSIVESHWTIYSQQKPTSSEILNKHSGYIEKTYKLLGGLYSVPPTSFGNWDISTTKFIIELDEERHFNRYRLATLQSDVYNNHHCFSLIDYKTYCIDYEANCLKAASWGGNWKNHSTEKQFGISNIGSDLTSNGSSRWKQRAYYDFLKDISSQIIQVPIIRISIYDKYKKFTVDQLLKANQDQLLLPLLDKRISSSFDFNKHLWGN